MLTIYSLITETSAILAMYFVAKGRTIESNFGMITTCLGTLTCIIIPPTMLAVECFVCSRHKIIE